MDSDLGMLRDAWPAGETPRAAINIQTAVMEADLRCALTRDDLTLYYQPVVDLQRRRLAGFEALLRWRCPGSGWVAPERFVNLAGTYGIGEGMTEWILLRAERDLAALMTRHQGLTLSIRLSADETVPQRIARLGEILTRCEGLAASRLQIEINERTLLEDRGAVRHALETLSATGVGLTLGNVGTAYASLGYIDRYPIDGLKIGRSFVDRLADGRSRKLMAAILLLAGALEIATLAEGVETVEQLGFLQAHGCSRAQGVVFAPPLTADMLEDFIAAFHFPNAAQRSEDNLAPTPRASAPLLAEVLDALPDLIYVKDLQHRFLMANPALVAELGAASEADVIGRTDGDFHPMHLAEKYREQEARVIASGEAAVAELPAPRGHGPAGWYSVTKAPLRDADGILIGIIGHGRDITEQRNAEAELQRQTIELQRLGDLAAQARREAESGRDMLVEAASATSNGFALFDQDDRVAVCNEVFSSAFGSPAADLVGITFSELLRRPFFRAGIALDGYGFEAWLERRMAQHRAATGAPMEFELGGRWYLVRERRSNSGMIFLSRADITHLKTVEDKLRQLATRDELTGLPNRRDFVTQVARLCEGGFGGGHTATVILFDIDNFKRINDSHGHGIGDEVLRQVAQLCTRLLRPTDLVARWGGEEFIQLTSTHDAQAAWMIAERLRGAIADMVVPCGELQIRLTASFGVAQGDCRSEALDALIERADHALYCAKQAGRNRIELAGGQA